MDTTVPVGFQERAFRAILSLQGNHHCADCSQPGPEWASLNLGAFVCFKCSGVHRGLGLHITRVKSTKLDSWTLKQMYIMSLVNNQETNSYWEAKLFDDRIRPTDESSTEQLKSFIYDKYVHKKFISPTGKPPIDKMLESDDFESGMDENESKEHYFQRKLKQLEEMIKSKTLVGSRNHVMPFGTGSKEEQEAEEAGMTKEEYIESLKAIKGSKHYKQRLQSNPDAQINLSPTKGVTIPKDPRKRGAGSSQFEDLSLFEGLTVKGGMTPAPKQTPTEWDSDLGSRTPLGLNSNAHASGQLLFPSTHIHGSNAGYRQKREKTSFSKNQKDNEKKEIEMLDISEISGKDENKSNGHSDYKEKSINLLEDEHSQEDHELEEQKHKDNKQKDTRYPPKVQTTTSLMDISPMARKGEAANFGTTPSQQRLGDRLKRAATQELDALRVNTVHSVSRLMSRTNLGGPPSRYPKWLILLSCVILHVAFGYIYSWGNISPYLAFFFTKDYEEAYYLDVASYSALTFLGFTLGFAYSEKAINAFGYRKTSFACFISLYLMFMLCAWSIAPTSYSCIPTLVAGFFIGVAYMIPYYCALQYYPDHPNHLKAFFYIIDGLGSLIFSYSCYTYLDNESSFDAHASVKGKSTYYPEEIIEEVPDLVEFLGYKLLILGLLGSVALKSKFDFVEKDRSALRDKGETLLRSRRSTLIHARRKGPKSRDLKHALVSPASKALLQIAICSSVLGGYYLYAHKVIGLDLGYSDSYLSILGSLGVIAMSLGKCAAIIGHKKWTFRVCLNRAVISLAVLGLVAVVLHQWLFIYLLPVMFVGGFVESLIREEVTATYGEEIEVNMTALMMSGYVISMFLSFTIAKIGDYVLSYRFLNLLLILPLIRVITVEKRYAGEVKNKTSVAESEIARILADE